MIKQIEATSDGAVYCLLESGMIEILWGSPEEERSFEYMDIFTEFRCSDCGNLIIVQRDDTELLPSTHSVMVSHAVYEAESKFRIFSLGEDTDWLWDIDHDGRVRVKSRSSDTLAYRYKWTWKRLLPKLPNGDTARKVHVEDIHLLSFAPEDMNIAVFSDQGYIYTYRKASRRWTKVSEQLRDCTWRDNKPIMVSLDGYIRIGDGHRALKRDIPTYLRKGTSK